MSAICPHGNVDGVGCELCSIAELEAELAEARRDLHEERSRANDYGKAIERERAAHERTKAELVAEHADRLNIDEHRGRLLRERDAAQADATAMREALGWALGHDECFRDEFGGDPSEDGDSPMATAMRAALAGTVGRALAARVSLLEATVQVARGLRWVHPLDRGRYEAKFDVALAALDAKEPK